ncbi:MAG: sigma-70 family RNA polymerase sigma factor [Candidatus Limnocylindrales bacterium]
MPNSTERPQSTPEQFRSYLRLLAEMHLGRHAGAKLDPSDVIQQTLLDAYRGRDQFRGRTDAEMAAWLRRLLTCNLADAQRARGRAKRDAARERSLEQALDASSARIEAFLAAEQSSPSQRAMRNEAVLRLAEALASLPEANRQALVLRHLQGLSLAKISAELGRTPAAVAGLIKRGLIELRSVLADLRE